MIVSECEQLSEAWFDLRRGRPTASRFKDIITPKTGKLSASAPGYMRELVAECFVKDFTKWLGNAATERGLELEPEALAEFELETGLKPKKVGFVTRDDGVVGCSPDGLIYQGDSPFCGVEAKCPAAHTHIGYIESGGLPDKYRPQVHGGMAVTGLDRWHFYSYFPGMRSLHVVVQRDAYTEQVSAALDQFLIDYRDYRDRIIPRIQLPAQSD